MTINSIPASLANCIQTYDVSYKYANGPKPEIFRLLSYETKGVRESYVPQASPDHCYAAALSIAFKSQGYDYPQALFANAIANACFATGRQPLTFSQILFSATKVRGQNGIWFIDRPDQYFSNAMNALADSGTKNSTTPGTFDKNGFLVLPRTRKDVPVMVSTSRCMSKSGVGPKVVFWFGLNTEQILRRSLGMPKLPPGFPTLETPPEAEWIDELDLYSEVYWTQQGSPVGQRDGQYLVIRDPRDFIEKLQTGATVIAGMSEGGPGHVVVVSSVIYAAMNVPMGQVIQVPHPSGHVVSVNVMDPATKDMPEHTYVGDEFFKQSRFLIALVNHRKAS